VKKKKKKKKKKEEGLFRFFLSLFRLSFLCALFSGHCNIAISMSRCFYREEL